MRHYTDIMLILTLYLLPFTRYSAYKISFSDLDLPVPPKVKNVKFYKLYRKAHMRLYNGILLSRTLYLVPFARYFASNISVSDLDLSGLPKVKYLHFVGKPICDIIMVFC